MERYYKIPPQRVVDLLSLLGCEKLPDKIPSEIVECAQYNGLTHLLCAMQGARKALSDETMTDCRIQAAKGSLKLMEFREISAAMKASGIEIAPQKGMAYGLMFEDGGPLRSMLDIDILVHSSCYLTAQNVMLELGYTRNYNDKLAAIEDHHESQFIRHGSVVEIHKYFARGKRINVDYDSLWNRTRPLANNGVVCRRLSPEDTLLFHCFHMGMHGFMFRGLLYLWELKRLLQEDNPDLDVCAVRAEEWGIFRILYSAFRLLGVFFPDIPEFKLKMVTEHEHTPRLWTNKLLLDLALEHVVIEPFIRSLSDDVRIPGLSRLFRKFILVDRLSSALSHMSWYYLANIRAKIRSHLSS